MRRWIAKVRQRTEDDFIPWYSDYWTQQWLAVKLAWFKMGDAPLERLTAYVREQYEQRVLEPVGEEIDPREVMDRAATLYVHGLRQRIRRARIDLRVPPEALNRRLDTLPAIVAPRKEASLRDILQAEKLTRVPAYQELVAETGRSDTPDSVMAEEQLEGMATDVAERFAEKLAARGGATATALAGGPVGILVSAGIAAWGVIDHQDDKPELQAEARRQLDAAMAVLWRRLVEDPDRGVLAPVLHMSAQIEAGKPRVGRQRIPLVEELF
jgi:hypothetical protein